MVEIVSRRVLVSLIMSVQMNERQIVRERKKTVIDPSIGEEI